MKTLLKQEKKDKIKKIIKKSFENAFIGLTALTLSCGGEDIQTKKDSKDYKFATEVRIEEVLDESLFVNYNERQIEFINWLNIQCKRDVKFAEDLEGSMFGEEKIKIAHSRTIEKVNYGEEGNYDYNTLINVFDISNATNIEHRFYIENFGEDSVNGRITMRFRSYTPSTGSGKKDYYGNRTGTGLPKGFSWNIYVPTYITGGGPIHITFTDNPLNYNQEEHGGLSYVYVCKTILVPPTGMIQELLIVPPQEIQQVIKDKGITNQDIEEMENLSL